MRRRRTTAKEKRTQWIERHSTWRGNDCLRWPFGSGDWYHSVKKSDGTFSKAHRLMCEAAHGKPDDGQMALHSCGNKWCVNQRHLRWGSARENTADARHDGSLPMGESSWQAVLTEGDVRKARKLRADGLSYNALAKRFGITRGAIWHAVQGTQWKHVK